jgi:predicted nucleic acid-binding protein
MTSGTFDNIVINTSPLIAIMLGCGNWEILEHLGAHVVVPRVVVEELRSGPTGAPGRDASLPSNVEIADKVLDEVTRIAGA